MLWGRRNVQAGAAAKMIIAAALVGLGGTTQFSEVEEAPMARFHKVGEMMTESIYGHIILRFNVSEIRRQTTSLQMIIADIKSKATTDNRNRYDKLSETLRAAEKELDDDMRFFTVLARRSRSFGEWLGGVLGLWNAYEIHDVKKLEESTREALLIEAHHVDAVQAYAEASHDDLEDLAKRISRQAALVWSRVDDITETADIEAVVAPVRAISKIAATLTAHRLDPAILSLVDMGKVWSDYSEKTEAAGWHIALDGWQDSFHLPTSYHATTQVLTIAVRLPLVQHGQVGYELLRPTFFPIMHGSNFYDVSTSESVLAWEGTGETYLSVNEETLGRCINAGEKYYCNEAMVVMQGTPQTCLSAIWMSSWSAIRARCRLWSRPAVSSAMRINETHTVVTAPEQVEVQVTCPERPKVVRTVSGQWWLAMEAGCTALTATWEIASRATTTMESETVIVSLHTNTTAWVGFKDDFEVRTPAPVHSIGNEIAETLRRGESSLPGIVILAVGAAVAAVAIVASFIGISYLKFRNYLGSGVSEAADAAALTARAVLARANSV